MERWFSRRVITRMPQLIAGIVLLGFGVAMMDAGGLGFGPWSVLAEGFADQVGIALGTADILIGIPILLGWVLVRERPGIGTLLNVFGVGLAINAGIAILPEPEVLAVRVLTTTAGMVTAGTGIALKRPASGGPAVRDVHLDVPPLPPPEDGDGKRRPRQVAEDDGQPDVVGFEGGERLVTQTDAQRDDDL